MNQTTNFYYEFGNHRLEPKNKRLFRESEVVKLPPKVFETLLLLVEKSGQTVSKEELFDKIWSDTIVEENNLSQNIFQLRKTLNNGDKSVNYIETLPKCGYRFTAKVQKIISDNQDFLDNEKSKSATINGNGIEKKEKAVFSQSKANYFSDLKWKVAILGCLLSIFCLVLFSFIQSNKTSGSVENNTVTNHSIAVLPFKHLEGNTDEHLQTGIADALTSRLSSLPQLKVLSTSAILQAKANEPLQIGKELQVETILTGVIQEADEKVRITVQLVDVKDGSILWTEKYDLAAQNLFELQDNISEKILSSLEIQISPTENKKITKRFTDNLEAFEAYSRGRYLLNKRDEIDLNKAEKYFRQAVERDPKFGFAYSELATTQLILASNNSGTNLGKEKQQQAKVNALKAVETDDSLGEPHAVLASISYNEGDNWEDSQKEFLTAIKLNPNLVIAHQWYSWHLFLNGQFQEAEAEMKKAHQLDPSSFSVNFALGQIYFFTKHYDLALIQFDRTLELEPNDVLANSFYSMALAQMERFDEAINKLETFEKINKDIRPTLGYVLALAGKKQEARQIIVEFERKPNLSGFDFYGLSLIYLALGENDKSLEFLRRIGFSRNRLIHLRLKYDPRLDLLRKQNEFKRMFPAYSTSE